MEIIKKRLESLQVNEGVYLVLPNYNQPLFIIPMNSRWAYKRAISLIKTKNAIGNFKKKILAAMPFFVVKRLFFTIEVRSTAQGNHKGQLILPWNQDSNNKFTIFDFEEEKISLTKIGFGEASRLIDNEFNCISLVSETSSETLPEIIDYVQTEEYSRLQTKFYKGHHPKVIPKNLTDFFRTLYLNAERKPFKTHPYITQITEVIIRSFVNDDFRQLSDSLQVLLHRFTDEEIPVVIMHGDCSMTNIISKGNICKLIDWEEGVIEGIPIDLIYFKFRQKIDQGSSWKINNALSFLTVLHYFYFQIKHGNQDALKRFNLINGILQTS